MADPFMGEIRMFAGGYSPRNWTICDGQLLDIGQFSSLFAVMGTTYGGDGRKYFGLPNLKDRVPMGNGTGPGLSPRIPGYGGGSSLITLTQEQMPSHNHQLSATLDEADQKTPFGNALAKGKGRSLGPRKIPLNLYNERVRDHAMSEYAVQPEGGSQSHSNMQPYIGIYFILCVIGAFAPRN